jgi:hypothetical protein
MLIDGVRLVTPKTPPHGLKLGPAPCFVVPPRWIIDEEADIETPIAQAAKGKALAFTPHLLITNDKSGPGGP